VSESVSVVIPTYNRASDLERVLDSYLAQPEVGEVIVVDDGSIDRTPDLLGCWPAGRVPLRAVRLDTNQGQATARNVGADAARGEYIFYGEDDYTPGPSHVAVLLQHLARSGADLIAGRRVNVRRDESFGAALRRAGIYRGPLIERWAAVQNPWVDAGADVEAPLRQRRARVATGGT